MVTPSTHIRYADVAVVVYDVTESNTVDALSNWLEKAVLFGPEHLTIILCGNKTDISRDEWQDNAATLRQMKQKNRVSGHVMTSAKEEGGLQALKEEIMKQLLKREITKLGDTTQLQQQQKEDAKCC